MSTRTRTRTTTTTTTTQANPEEKRRLLLKPFCMPLTCRDPYCPTHVPKLQLLNPPPPTPPPVIPPPPPIPPANLIFLSFLNLFTFLLLSLVLATITSTRASSGPLSLFPSFFPSSSAGGDDGPETTGIFATLLITLLAALGSLTLLTLPLLLTTLLITLGIPYLLTTTLGSTTTILPPDAPPPAPRTPRPPPAPPLTTRFAAFLLSLLTLFTRLLSRDGRAAAQHDAGAAWLWFQRRVDPYAYALLYEQPARAGDLAAELYWEPWRVTQVVGGGVRFVVALAAFVVLEVAQGGVLLGRGLARWAGEGRGGAEGEGEAGRGRVGGEMGAVVLVGTGAVLLFRKFVMGA